MSGNEDLRTQQILLAAARHDVESLRVLFRNCSANVQDDETGTTPLHAAIAACEPDSGNPDNGVNGAAHYHGNGNNSDDMQRAEHTLKLLFENGAVWNDLDGNMETPGCLARRLDLKSLYDIVVDAGVRTELLFMRLDEYAPIPDSDSDHADDEEGLVTVNDKTIDVVDTPTGPEADLENANYLESALDITQDRVLDASANGVMMLWESPIMRRTAELLLPHAACSALNIGHGLGLMDGFLQNAAPAKHHIIEAHPAVLQKMREGGWYGKPGVTVHEGTWQSVVPRLVQQGEMFDAVYFDTFAEDYSAFKEFCSEHMIALLKPAGRWSFFHGLGADRQVCYDVYTKVSQPAT